MSLMTFRRLALLVTALGLALAPLASQAQVPANVNACQAQAANLIDEWLHSPDGGDKDFFTTETGTPPNLLFLLDNSGSMRGMVRPVSGTGCVDPFYRAIPYNGSETYPDFHPNGHPGGNNSYGGFSGLYVKGRVYRAENSETAEATSIADFCDSRGGDCSSCLTNYGFWRDGSGRSYFDGNFLNVFPPRYVMARRAVAEAIHGARNVRMAVVLFDSSNNRARWLGTGISSSGMNPPCNLAYPPDRSEFHNNRTAIIKAINDLGRGSFNTGTYLANSLMNMGQYYNEGGDAYRAWGFPTVNAFDSATNHTQRSICWGCQLSAAVIITDGEPWQDSTQIPSEIADLCLDPTDADCPNPLLHCPECGNDLWNDRPNTLHKVAWWLANRDVNHRWPGTQSVSTYTIGFAIDHPLLQRTAQLGNGLYFPATDAESLRRALDNVVDDMLNRSASFTTTSLAGVQSQAVQSVLVPKFVPNKQGPWPGELFRFDFLSEFVIEMDLDGDDRQSSFFLVDSDCTVPATGEDLDWNAIRAGEAGIPSDCVPVREATAEDVNTNPTLELGRFYKTQGFDDPTLTTVRARPFWEANDELRNRDPLDRRIYTFIDTNNDGELERVRFHPNNVDQLLPYLGLKDSSFCLATGVDVGVLPEDFTESVCAQTLIKYILGCRLPKEPTDLLGCEPRDHMLGDIFHSPPTIIEPPTPLQLMETPFRHDQSPWTLSHDKYFESDADGDANAYGVFAESHAERPRVALVGSNSGMLHAFHAGEFIESVGFDRRYTRGSGEELWAVIPPTLLPRLRHMPPHVGEPYRHRYYVDGQPWVRNIWVDGLGDPGAIDHRRQPGEYRTVAVTAMRQGGNRWFALDVTNVGDDGYEPELLWLFPRIGSPWELFVAQSWNDVQPKPPPIGPIRYKNDGPASPAPDHLGEEWRERWVIGVPGGHDSRQMRGRGLFILDVFTGEVLWDFYHPESSGSGVDSDDPRWNLAYSIASPPTFVAWGDQVSYSIGNAYFDTFIAGDTGGQLWVGRMSNPDPASWSAARVFEPALDPGADDRNTVAWHPPFFQSPHLTLIPETNYLRAYLGAGDRAHLREPVGGVCSPTNPGACVRSGTCNIREFHLHNLDFGPARNHYRYETDDVGGRLIAKRDARMDMSTLSSNSCPDVSVGRFTIDIDGCVDYDGNAIDRVELEGRLDCEFEDGRYECSRNEWNIERGDPDALACTDTSGTARDRFYSIRIFGGHDDLKPFNTLDEAIDFDRVRLTTGTGADDVVRANPDDGAAPAVTAASAGWYHEYTEVSERTATSAVTAGPCAIWSTLRAPTANMGCVAAGRDPDNDQCSTQLDCPCGESTTGQEAFMYFRNYITGANDCVAYPPEGWDADESRVSVGTQPQPPPAPQVISQVSGSGQVRTSVATTEDSVDISDAEDLLTEFSIIDVPADVHMWRHAACHDSVDARCH